MKTQRGEVSGRILLGDNRQRDGHATNYQFVVCWNLYFGWTPMYVCAVGHMYTMDLPERNYCLSRGVSVNRLVEEVSHKACF